MIYFLCTFVLIFTFIFLHFKLWLHFSPKHRLPVLMYHHILPNPKDNLEVSPKAFELQLQYLSQKKYTFLHFKELETLKKLPKKSIILTFDDGYQNNLKYAYPLLKKYHAKATIMLPTAWLNHPQKETMHPADLSSMSSKVIEFGLHGHKHLNYSATSLGDIEKDIEENLQAMQHLNLSYSPVLAYAYGQYPRKNMAEFSAILKRKSIKYGLRIGNKLNYYPFLKPYEICRIHIKEKDNLQKFRLRLFFGKLKFF